MIDMGHIGHGHILSYFDNTMKITFVWANFTRMYITEILADLAHLINLIIISGFMTVTMTAAVLTWTPLGEIAAEFTGLDVLYVFIGFNVAASNNCRIIKTKCSYYKAVALSWATSVS